MDITTILTLVSIVLGLGATLLGGKWLIAKNKLGQFKTVVKEGIDVVTAAIDAVEDDKITVEEINEIKMEVAEFKAAGKILLSKESS